MDPTMTLLYDWMHCIFVAGVFNRHMGQLLYFLSGLNITYQTIHTYMELYRWPKRVGSLTGKASFTGSRATSNAAARLFKCSASEGLSTIYVMAQYVRAGVARSPDWLTRAHAMCFLMLFNIVFLIEASSRVHVDASLLEASVDTYLRLYLSLYGSKSMIIKFHWLHHFPVFLRRWGRLPSCFALERKHRIPKRYANNIRNTSSSFDASCLREVTCHHLNILRDVDFSGMILGRIGKTKARINTYEVVSNGDVVLFAYGDGGAIAAGVIVGFPTAVAANIRMWSLIEKEQYVSRWDARTPNQVLAGLTSIKAACIYALAGQVATVLHPARC